MNIRGAIVTCTASLALLLLHCSSGGSGSLDGGADGGGCPQAAPTAGSACALASGTVCGSYATAAPGCYCCSGGSNQFVCQNGKWVEFSTGGPPSGGTPTGCAATVPVEGSSCSPCGATPTCNYSCATGNGSVSTAECTGGTWHVTKSLAPCQTDASLVDGADASGAQDAGDSG